MKIAQISDLHTTEGVRLDDQVRTYQSILDYLRDDVPDVILLTGDLAGYKVPHRTTPAERAVLCWFFCELAALAPLIIVEGNHDAPKDAAIWEALKTEHPVIVAQAQDGIQRIDRLEPLIVWAVPYPRRTVISEHLRKIGRPADHATVIAAGSPLLDQALLIMAERIRDEPGRLHVVAGHLAVTGAAVAGGERLASREVEASVAALDQLRAAGACYVGLGHIHLAQTIVDGVRYAGSVHRANHGEVEEEKTFTMVEIVGGKPYIEAVPVWARRFVTIDAEYRDGGWLMPEADVADAEVRLRLKIPDEYRATADRAAAEALVIEAGAERFITEINIVREARVRSTEIAEATDDGTKVKAYWGTLDDPPEEADQKAALQVLNRLEHSDDIVGEIDAQIAALFGDAPLEMDHGTVDAEDLRRGA